MHTNFSRASIAMLAAAPILGAVLLAGSASAQTVTIVKYVNGQPATASSAGSATFPMSATWQDQAQNGGATQTGSFTLGPTGFNNGNPYQATTNTMSPGSSYSAAEVAQNSCTTAYPFSLVGYSAGTTLANAAAAQVGSSAPQFTNLQGDEYEVVWNQTCPSAPTPLFPQNGATLSSQQLTELDWNAVSDPSTPVQYFYEVSNSLATNADGSLSSPVYQSGGLSSPSVGTSNTAAGTYYWNVRAEDSAGHYSPWSSVSSFTVTGTPSNPATTTAQVHILAYLNGSEATASSAGSYLFPMASAWQAVNVNGGATTTGSYTLGNNFGGAPDLYGALTSPMQTPAYYTTSEITTDTGSSEVVPAGASCSQGEYQLRGYSVSSTSFADAANQPITTTAPSFQNLGSDEYVIVWNETCGSNQGGGTPPPTQQGSGTLSGTVFVDQNGNRSFDSGEQGLSGWTILLLGSHGTHQTVTTDANGNYSFSNLKPGWYVALTKLQQQWLPTVWPVPVRVSQNAGAANQNFGVESASSSSNSFFPFGFGLQR